MKAYRYTLRPLSAWATPWHADTLWGSLCWAWRELAGKDALEDLLDRFPTEKNPNVSPPFVLSDAFPVSLLPFPLGANDGRTVDQKGKSLWCRVTDFEAWADGTTAELPAPPGQQTPFRPYGLLHAQRSRLTDSTEGGELFEMDQSTFHPDFPKEEDRVLSVYIRTEEAWLAPLRACWDALSCKGFGARSSTGLGSFELVGSELPCDWLDIKDSHNGFLSLSHFVPAKTDPHDGYWKLHVKNPKFAATRVPLPFKGNLITLTPGSRFRTGTKPQPFYGRMLPTPRTGFQKALHCGLALAAPLTWEK